MALRATVFASFARSAINLSLRETPCALRETLCPLAFLLAVRAPHLTRSLLGSGLVNAERAINMADFRAQAMSLDANTPENR
jgi:hypothetical protein